MRRLELMASVAVDVCFDHKPVGSHLGCRVPVKLLPMRDENMVHFPDRRRLEQTQSVTNSPRSKIRFVPVTNAQQASQSEVVFAEVL